MTSIRVRSVRAARLDVPLTEPFGIATGRLERAANLVVTLELDDGAEGIGEAAPFPAVSGETQESTEDALGRIESRLAGRTFDGWRAITAALRRHEPKAAAARAAVEVALFDALARRRGSSLLEAFGGAETRLVTDVTIPTGGVEAAARAAARRTAEGFTTLKVKVGEGDLDLDLRRLVAVRAAAPHARLVVDGNGGFDVAGARAFVAGLSDAGIELALFEQPTPREDVAALRAVRREASVPVAADESVRSATDAIRLVREEAVDVLNVKLMKCGLEEGLQIAAIARAAGVGLMIGAMLETRLGISASACLAAGVGGFAFVDLDTPLFLTEDPFVGGVAFDGAALDLSAIDVGHGVRRRGP